MKELLFLEEEGECPNHVIILHQGRFFKLVPFDDDGEPWDINKLETVILQIERVAVTKSPNVDNSVGVLTTLDRDEWAKVYILEFFKPNCKIIKSYSFFNRLD